MILFSPVTWIVNAAAVFRGDWGDVSRRAGEAGCSRQTIYQHATKVEEALLRPTCDEFERLQAQNQRIQLENQQLWDWLEQTVDVSDKRRRRVGFSPRRRMNFRKTWAEAHATSTSVGHVTVEFPRSRQEER